MSKVLIGIVCSDKLDKTIVVSVQTRKEHPLYRKKYTVSKKFMAHDSKNQAKIGDHVSIIACRPLSARKRFMLERIIKTAEIKHVEAETVIEAKPDNKPLAKAPKIKETKA